MFGLFKPKPAPSGAVTFDFDILIERPVEDVYPLLDWADPRNAKRQLGHKVEGDGTQFVLTIESMPDHRFNLGVTEARPNEVYAFTCDIQPKQVGKSGQVRTWERGITHVAAARLAGEGPRRSEPPSAAFAYESLPTWVNMSALGRACSIGAGL